MDKKNLFLFLQKQDQASLLSLLENAYDTMIAKQRKLVFGHLPYEAEQPEIDAAKLLSRIETFYQESQQGVYYAPFGFNSQNFNYIPEETEEWFDKLYELIDKMGEGDGIVFAHEYGTWMIPGDQKSFIRAYLHSLADLSSAEEFAAMAIPLIKQDSYESFAHKVYQAAIKAAKPEQKKLLVAEIKREKIRVK